MPETHNSSHPISASTSTRSALGCQLLVDLYGCDRALLNDVTFVRKQLLEAARQAGATVVGEIPRKFAHRTCKSILRRLREAYAVSREGYAVS